VGLRAAPGDLEEAIEIYRHHYKLLAQRAGPADLEAWTAEGAKLSEEEALNIPLGDGHA
jgi:hypothetical protein